MSKLSAAVVGAVNIDIGGQSKKQLIARDSNPGHISITVGGVGRNIAGSLARLGHDVDFITALGGDMWAETALSDCKRLGLCTDSALRAAEERSSVYLYISQPDGDMALAVSDMEITRRITPEFLESVRHELDKAEVLVLDCNLSEDAILWLCNNINVPIIADPVSVTKAKKLVPVLQKLRVIKPNLLEAQAITGEAAPEKCAAALCRMGAARAFVSLGADGLCACEGGFVSRFSSPPTSLADATGAGDAMTAALASAFLRGFDIVESARFALGAAAITAESCNAVSDELSFEAAAARARILSI